MPALFSLDDATCVSDATHISDAAYVSDVPSISDATHVSDMTHVSDATRVSGMPHVSSVPHVSDATRVSVIARPANDDPAQPPSSADIAMFRHGFAEVSACVSSEIIGKPEAVRRLLVALFAGGHVLLEDEPGTGKTRLARAVARAVDADFGRIQFTPDLLPSDVVGTVLFDQQHGMFSLRKGPVFASLVLGDEINRASPKTQSALLEVMEEGHVTIDGTTHDVPDPFMVIATQNPTGHLGTYALPEAQMDRFMMRISLGHPNRDSSVEILRRANRPDAPGSSVSASHAGNHGDTGGDPRNIAVMTPSQVAAMRSVANGIHVDDGLLEYIIRLVEETRHDEQVRSGVSMRGALALLRCARVAAAADGRGYVLPDDVMEFAVPVLAHRLMLTDDATFVGVTQQDVVQRIVEHVPAPFIGHEGNLP